MESRYRDGLAWVRGRGSDAAVAHCIGEREGLPPGSRDSATVSRSRFASTRLSSERERNIIIACAKCGRGVSN